MNVVSENKVKAYVVNIKEIHLSEMIVQHMRW